MLALVLFCTYLYSITYVQSCVTGVGIPSINVNSGGSVASASGSSDTAIQQGAEKLINTLQYIPTGNYIDAADNAILPFINKALTSVFKGDLHAEIYATAANGPVTCPADLNCDFSKKCRWKNADSGFLKWYKGTGKPNQANWESYTSSKVQPRPPYLLLAAKNGVDSALFISDPVPSQPKDGLLTFKYWSTPLIGFKVCVRKPGSEQMLGCTKEFNVDGNSEDKNVTIKGPIDSKFEIVFVGGPFRIEPGGMMFIDDITYSSTICDDKFEIKDKTSDTIATGVNSVTLTKATKDPSSTTSTVESTTTQSSGSSTISSEKSKDKTDSDTKSSKDKSDKEEITLTSTGTETNKENNSSKDDTKKSSKEKISSKSTDTKEKSKDSKTEKDTGKPAKESEDRSLENYKLGKLNQFLKVGFNGDTGDMKASHYDPSDDKGLVKQPKDLNCNFESSCHWRQFNNESVELDFYLTTGKPNADKFSSITTTKTQPKFPCIMTAGLRNSQGAWLVSDPIKRKSTTTTLKFKYWLSPVVHMKVCQSTDELKTFQQCSDVLKPSEDAEKSVKLQGKVGEKLQIAFVYDHFTYIQGGAGFIDDITYEDDNY